MAISPIDIATEGYLNSPLSVAASGYLIIEAVASTLEELVGTGGRRIGGGRNSPYIDYFRRKERLKKIALQEDEEIIKLIMEFVKRLL